MTSSILDTLTRSLGRDAFAKAFTVAVASVMAPLVARAGLPSACLWPLCCRRRDRAERAPHHGRDREPARGRRLRPGTPHGR